MESNELRRVGLKVTHPRMRILELLEGIQPQHHLTAEDIYRHLLENGDEIGLATVYRVLTQFEAAGLVIKHNFEGGQAIYELDRGGHHDHMVDVDTGKIIEFESAEIEALQRQIAASHGYELEEHSLVLYVRKKRR
ncbi:MAG: ferric iron uptake transcriptional regulator [Pseudoxanthomonas sp.]|mgnify:FL=1|nr:ferric iron uptake transcriptional regulator [Pseudoxanthomonas sp.]MDZ3799240.1 ferric iron uptake transcriptional regulator [Xanthomonadales bacterium]MBP8741808.1 ferric iron uptake transcriptional regulator [Pseudoxanthomonas sp.]MBP8804460.1 ferric iron uptake transcriptional regulator [Pseudoxanthomonas sp.]MBP9534961.1 ferric iron uptake transcriptional regulator [Pseudoxanthomonas sp.]